MKPKILVADDDFDNRTIVREVLEASGYDVFLATDGEDALGQVSLHKPEVLLLDLSMPKLNGWELAKRIRQHSEWTEMPIIAFTAHALVGDELKAKAAGCDDYLSKPCMPKDVASKVAYWLHRRARAA